MPVCGRAAGALSMVTAIAPSWYVCEEEVAEDDEEGADDDGGAPEEGDEGLGADVASEGGVDEAEGGVLGGEAFWAPAPHPAARSERPTRASTARLVGFVGFTPSGHFVKRVFSHSPGFAFWRYVFRLEDP